MRVPLAWFGFLANDSEICDEKHSQIILALKLLLNEGEEPVE